MIHFDKAGNVIESFDALQGHGVAVDKQASVYIAEHGPQLRPEDRQDAGGIPYIPDTANGQPFDTIRESVVKSAAGPVADSSRGGRAGEAVTGVRRRREARRAATQAQLQQSAFIARHPLTTLMIVGGIEEIRTDDAVNEIYVADNAFGGRVMVFSLDVRVQARLARWPQTVGNQHEA